MWYVIYDSLVDMYIVIKGKEEYRCVNIKEAEQFIHEQKYREYEREYGYYI